MFSNDSLIIPYFLFFSIFLVFYSPWFAYIADSTKPESIKIGESASDTSDNFQEAKKAIIIPKNKEPNDYKIPPKYQLTRVLMT